MLLGAESRRGGRSDSVRGSGSCGVEDVFFAADSGWGRWGGAERWEFGG